MKHLLCTLGFALAALPPVASQAQDASAWDGFNVGLQVSAGSGRGRYPAFSNEYDLDGNSFGAFAG